MIKSSAVVLIVALMLLICERNFVFHSIENKQSVPSFQKEFLISSVPAPVPLELHVSYYVVRNSANAAKKLKHIMAPDLVEQNRTA
jgi:hypothetical protein